MLCSGAAQNVSAGRPGPFLPCKSVYFYLLYHHTIVCSITQLKLSLHQSTQHCQLKKMLSSLPSSFFSLSPSHLRPSDTTLPAKPSPRQPRSSCDWLRPAPAAWRALTLWTTSSWRASMWWRTRWGFARCRTASESSTASTRPLLQSRCVCLRVCCWLMC